jgi:YD repeat-containing protein
MAYNERNQKTHQWGSSQYPLKIEYDDFGRQYKLFTYRSGSNWDQESWPEQLTGKADTTTWIYDEASGYLKKKVDAKNKAVSYTYDRSGRLSTRTWARKTNKNEPLVTTYSYDDKTGQLTNVDYSDQTKDLTFSYNRRGQLKSVNDALGNRNFYYNDAFHFNLNLKTFLAYTMKQLQDIMKPKP